MVVDTETEALGHTYESVVTEPTCTETGYTTHTCTVCGHVVVDTKTEALGHDMSDWTVVKEPTLNAEGEQTRHCQRKGCDYSETQKIAKLDKLATPAITKLENTTTGVKITWGKVNGAERYRVYVKTTGGWQNIGHTTDNSFSWTGAVSGETYTFTIRCVNAANNAFTSDHNATGWKLTYVAAPKISKLENTNTGIKITWAKVTGAEKYGVFVMTENGWKGIGTTTGTSFTWTGAESGKTYTFTLRAMNAAGNSFISAYDTTGWSQTFVATPSIGKLESTTSGIKISWNAVAGAGKYGLFVKTESGWKGIGTTTGTSFTWTGAEAGKTYSFTIRAMNAAGNTFISGYSNTGWSHKYYPTPAVSKLESTTSGIKLTWGAINGAGKYRVYVKTSSGWTRVGDSTGTSFTWTGAKAGETYTFTVMAMNAEGTAFVSNYNTTGWSHKYYPTPEITKLESTSAGVKITWGAINGAGKYGVFVKTETGWKGIGTSTGTSFTWTGAEKGKTYTFTVRAMNPADNSYVSSFSTTGWSITHK